MSEYRRCEFVAVGDGKEDEKKGRSNPLSWTHGAGLFRQATLHGTWAFQKWVVLRVLIDRGLSDRLHILLASPPFVFEHH